MTRKKAEMEEEYNPYDAGKHPDRERKSIDTCSICGGRLENRTGIFGKFVGCSNYPACTFTHNRDLNTATFKRLGNHYKP
jgi:ssDNA-binding Zn-finger/Zn-ribbon topoisomerase 1